VHRIETPVGTVTATLHADGSVSVRNVPAYRHLQGRRRAARPRHRARRRGLGRQLVLPGERARPARGERQPCRADRLHRGCCAKALAAQGITGAGGAEIDHIELFASDEDDGADSRNFVLCPGKAYDRSPCGTGTSAKIACLAADGKLAPGESGRRPA
jgi:4-hydroxyproline epimerase